MDGSDSKCTLALRGSSRQLSSSKDGIPMTDSHTDGKGEVTKKLERQAPHIDKHAHISTTNKNNISRQESHRKTRNPY